MDNNQIAEVNAFYDSTGIAWALIESAGIAGGDRPTGVLYKSFIEAFDARQQSYRPEELDPESPSCLHVEIARWDRVKEFWKYSY
ncbi:hypothetical protein [Brevundimonas naejangsanensis]|uniref:hypothetical protein n=1 Tax=Brevundimonas naejangsanensis TaxID=588932 RepID=UPI003D019300